MIARGLAKVIKRLREQNGWTQNTLAKKAKVTQAYVAQLEGGLRKISSASRKPLGVTALLEGGDE